MVSEAAAKSNLKKVSLELGGKSPLVILNDANVNEAAEIAHNAIFANHGQNCCAGSRTFVQEGIYDGKIMSKLIRITTRLIKFLILFYLAFVARAKELASQRIVGNPYDANTVQGPQVDEEIFQRILGYIESGKSQGAKLECGGKRWGDVGFFIEPTVFSNVTDNMKIAAEEVSKRWRTQ